jgi:hypothetical protein
MIDRREQKSRFTLTRALVASIVVHVILILLSWLMPEGENVSQAMDEETRLEFTFEQPPEPLPVPEEVVPEPEEAAEQAAVEEPDDVSIFDTGPLPDEIPTQDETMPSPSILGTVSDAALLDPTAPEVPDPTPVEGPEEEPQPYLEVPTEGDVEDVPEQPIEELVEEAPDEPAPEPIPQEPPVEDQPSGIDLEGERDDYRDTTEAVPEPDLDLSKAVQDLRQYLAQGGELKPPKEDEEEGRSGNPDGIEMPDLQDLPMTGFGMGDMVFESGDYDWSEYGRVVYTAIRRAWFNRLYQTTNSFDRWAFGAGTWALNHWSGIRFTIQGNGQITGIEVQVPSGCEPLDASATDALQEVVLPPLPSDFPRASETVQFRFIAQGDVRGMRRVLAYYKYMGAF